MSSFPFLVEHDVPLAPFSTLGLGGAARNLVVAPDDATAVAAVDWARERGMDLLVLGGGSNVVIPDAGFDGLVLRMASRGLTFERDGGRVLVGAAAGEPWDALVDRAVERDLAGVECLAGIPGLVGATPIQNVGAYGQDVSETIVAVRAFDRAARTIVELSGSACGFGYRDSLFKRRPESYVVLGVTFALIPGGAPAVRYRELENLLASQGYVAGTAPKLADVRLAVRSLRRKKSMLIDAGDPNHRSVGSFFMNPIVDDSATATITARAIARGAARAAADVPQFPAGDGYKKLSAAWLIEHAGFAKGFRRGAVGVSSTHALALVHHGGGTSDQLLRLARDIQDAVKGAWDIPLVPEPTIVAPAAPDASRPPPPTEKK